MVGRGTAWRGKARRGKARHGRQDKQPPALRLIERRTGIYPSTPGETMNGAVGKHVRDLKSVLDDLADAALAGDWDAAWEAFVDCDTMLAAIRDIVRRRAMEIPHD